MAIRLMTVDDVPKVMDYVVELTWQDGFHKYFFPGKWEHPFAYRRWWTQYVRNLVLKPGVYVYVLEEDSKILGWVTLVPGDNPPPAGLDLSKSSPREKRLRRFYRHHDSILEKIRPNRAVRNARLDYFRQVAMPEVRKTVLTGEDSHHWMIVEFFVDPALPRLEAEDVWKKLVDVGRKQCQADGVQYWAGVERSLVETFKAHEFEAKMWMEVGTVDFAVMKLDVSK
ncbi:uncharacterized protein TRIVIDRAFT_226140 [Trichoderma virens Gv29-8]|uniref:N-acetyltransferase domain-containing protein n=1 Tax=Hypocrea virens (strain Gv29-8 / FGSC 10586) TaxID=413071 RepID=G9N5H8_HYPVG|nr:uncharacterized protein TRIVIDRAFT_226140 [Trichoderma virens Gv29-8]EHK18023.1 hypothetical protein TRIVIDRAFT_226140 [Trichoderma virens Gv29-8]UKZ54115.1 hypothetical protein TrVGV298_007921 [Trichoderma virens]